MKIYHGKGFSCTIDDAVVHNWPDVSEKLWETDLFPIPVELIVLVADIEILQVRNTRRDSLHRILSSNQIMVINNAMQGWRDGYTDRIVDTSLMTVDDVVDAVAEILQKRG